MNQITTKYNITNSHDRYLLRIWDILGMSFGVLICINSFYTKIIVGVAGITPFYM